MKRPLLDRCTFFEMLTDLDFVTSLPKSLLNKQLEDIRITGLRCLEERTAFYTFLCCLSARLVFLVAHGLTCFAAFARSSAAADVYKRTVKLSKTETQFMAVVGLIARH